MCTADDFGRLHHHIKKPAIKKLSSFVSASSSTSVATTTTATTASTSTSASSPASSSTRGKHNSSNKTCDEKKPRRPLGAYNLFFRHERSNILSGVTSSLASDVLSGRCAQNDDLLQEIVTSSSSGAGAGAGAAAGEDNNSTTPVFGTSGPPSSSSAGSRASAKKQRAELVRVISARWRNLDAPSRAIFDGLAQLERKKYERDMAKWNRQKDAAIMGQSSQEKEKGDDSSDSSSSCGERDGGNNSRNRSDSADSETMSDWSDAESEIRPSLPSPLPAPDASDIFGYRSGSVFVQQVSETSSRSSEAESSSSLQLSLQSPLPVPVATHIFDDHSHPDKKSFQSPLPSSDIHNSIQSRNGQIERENHEQCCASSKRTVAAEGLSAQAVSLETTSPGSTHQVSDPRAQKVFGSMPMATAGVEQFSFDDKLLIEPIATTARRSDESLGVMPLTESDAATILEAIGGREEDSDHPSKPSDSLSQKVHSVDCNGDIRGGRGDDTHYMGLYEPTPLMQGSTLSFEQSGELDRESVRFLSSISWSG